MEMTILQNSYHRTCLGYAEMASYVYETTDDISLSTGRIYNVVRRSKDKASMAKYKHFCHLLKFKEAVPHLLRLLRAGGIWTVDCEKAYAALVKCRIEQVYQFHLKLFLYSFLSFFSLTGYCVYFICLCGPGRAYKQETP